MNGERRGSQSTGEEREEGVYIEKKGETRGQQQQPESETFKLFMSCCVVARAKKFQFCRSPSRRGGAAFRWIPFSFNPHNRHLLRILAHPAAISAWLICLDITSIPNILRSLIDWRIYLMRFQVPARSTELYKFFQIKRIIYIIEW